MSRKTVALTIRPLRWALPVIAAAVWAAAAVYPIVMLAARAVRAMLGDEPAALTLNGGRFLSWTLFAKSVLLAAGGAALAIVLSLPGAYAIGRMNRRGGRWIGGFLIAPLLFPPLVYALGWEMGPQWLSPLRCMWVWATWAWPVPALLLGTAWPRTGRQAYEQALVDSSRTSAFLRAGLPMMSRHLGVSFLLLFAFFAGNYSVPHGCGLIVHATELLLLAEASAEPVTTLLASLPIACVILAALCVTGLIWRRFPQSDDTEVAASDRGGVPFAAIIAIGLAIVCIVVPIARLSTRVDLGPAIVEAWRTYRAELVESVLVAACAGVVAVVAGAGLAAVRRVRCPALVWSLIIAALPGALVGEAIIAGYLSIPAVYDHWIIVVIGYLARFGWIGILAGWLAYAQSGRTLLDAALSDGAAEWQAAWRVAILPSWPTLLAAGCIVAALSMSEVATTSLVRVPSVNAVSLILIEKFHRLENGMLVSLSLMLVATAVPGSILAGIATARRRR